MEKSIKEFKAEYAEVKAEIMQIKQKLREAKKLANRVGTKAWKLDQVANKTMYIEDENGIRAKFKGLPKIMDELENWLTLENDISGVLDFLRS